MLTNNRPRDFIFPSNTPYAPIAPRLRDKIEQFHSVNIAFWQFIDQCHERELHFNHLQGSNCIAIDPNQINDLAAVLWPAAEPWDIDQLKEALQWQAYPNPISFDYMAKSTVYGTHVNLWVFALEENGTEKIARKPVVEQTETVWHVLADVRGQLGTLCDITSCVSPRKQVKIKAEYLTGFLSLVDQKLAHAQTLVQ